MESRISFIEARITRVEKLLYLVLIMSAPNVLKFLESIV